MNELTRGRAARWISIAMALAIMISLAVLTLPDSASGSNHLTVERDAGILLVSTGPDPSDNWVEYYPNPVMPSTEEGAPPPSLGAPEIGRQSLGTGRCDGVLDGSLLKLTPSGGNGSVGIVNSGLGVKAKNNCATAEGRVGPGQTLTFELGSRFVANDEDFFFDRVEIDVEGKFNARLGYDLGEERVGEKDLASGSDNGSDAGTSDNDIAEITSPTGDPLFASITFKAKGQPNSEVSIEGGGDGDVPGGELRTAFHTNQTLFRLVARVAYDGELDCATNRTARARGEETFPAEQVDVTRLANKTGECVAVPYRLHIDAEGVVFEPDLDAVDGQESAQFLVEIKWAPYEDPFLPPHRRISLSGELPGPDDFVEACTSLAEGPSPDLVEPDTDDTILHPTDVLWCMAGQRHDLLSSGTWQQIQWYHGGIDPRWV